LNPEAKLIAEWSNGVPLIVELPKGKGTVVGLNFFPPSCDTGDPRFWNSNSDGAISMANALAYAGGSHVLRKRRTISKRSLEIKSDGASESGVRDPSFPLLFFSPLLFPSSLPFFLLSSR
jgi:hypothetical protein